MKNIILNSLLVDQETSIKNALYKINKSGLEVCSVFSAGGGALDLFNSNPHCTQKRSSSSLSSSLQDGQVFIFYFTPPSDLTESIFKINLFEKSRPI